MRLREIIERFIDLVTDSPSSDIGQFTHSGECEVEAAREKPSPVFAKFGSKNVKSWNEICDER